jgi:mannosyltransferase OCH1-like enzyme
VIPKKIHYCWFGGNPLPEIVVKCINSWLKFLPDYEFIRWDEDNYDVYKNTFITDAYLAKKYAFVSDYARFDILSQYGGIYLDTDVEILKNLDNFLAFSCFTGFESYNLVNPGVIIGSQKDAELIAYMKSYYESVAKFNPNAPETVVSIITKYLVENGLKLNNTEQIVAGAIIFPTEYFAPLGFQTGKLAITPNTVSIHHYAGSWLGKDEIFKLKIFRFLTNLLGEKKFYSLRQLLKR